MDNNSGVFEYKEKVSIIVPVYNVEKYLKRCIESLINQTYSNIEILLIDDGSLDKSYEICKDYEKKDRRIKVFHKSNGGQGSARNVGLDFCDKNGYIMFVDSDDWISLNAVEILLKSIMEMQADLVICNFYAVYDDNNIVLMDTTRDCNYSTKTIKRKLLLDYWVNSMCDKIYKGQIFNNVRFPEGKTYEDAYIMPYVMNECNNIYCIKDALYYYDRSNMDSTTKKISSKNLYDIYAGWLQRLVGDFGLKAKDYEYCLNKTIKYAREAILINWIDNRLKQSEVEQLLYFLNKNSIKLKNNNYNKINAYLLIYKYKVKKVISNNRYLWNIWRKIKNNKG